jgi:capsid protein
MFGLAIMSEGSGESGFNEYNGETGEEPDADTDKYDFNMDMGLKIELDEGDKIDMFESKTPSNEYQDYVNLMLRIALLAFDLPYTFFDSRQSSYSAQKQDRAEYEISAKNKRAKNKEALNEIAEWVLPELIKGLKVDSLEWEFIPQATPWIDELKEVTASAMRISTGLSTRSLECKRKGLDFTEINEQLGLEEDQIKQSGATIVIGQSGQMTIGEDDNNATE